ELVLRDAEDREIAIALKDIEEKAVGGSLMPDGLTDTLTRSEFLDLVRFLTELGKVGPYSVSKARLVRRWEVLEPTSAAYELLARTSFASGAGSNPALTWSPAYSKVAGALPLDTIPRLEFRRPAGSESDSFGFVRCRVEASTGGKVKLLVNSTLGI